MGAELKINANSSQFDWSIEKFEFNEFEILINTIGNEFGEGGFKDGVRMHPKKLLKTKTIVEEDEDNKSQDKKKVAIGAEYIYFAMAYCTQIIQWINNDTGAHTSEVRGQLNSITETFKTKRRDLYDLLCTEAGTLNISPSKPKVSNIEGKITEMFNPTNIKLKEIPKSYSPIGDIFIKIATFFCRIWPGSNTKLLSTTSGNESIKLTNNLINKTFEAQVGGELKNKYQSTKNQDAFFLSPVESAKNQCNKTGDHVEVKVTDLDKKISEYTKKTTNIVNVITQHGEAKYRNIEEEKKLEEVIKEATKQPNSLESDSKESSNNIPENSHKYPDLQENSFEIRSSNNYNNNDSKISTNSFLLLENASNLNEKVDDYFNNTHSKK